jgi:hypothetical protein
MGHLANRCPNGAQGQIANLNVNQNRTGGQPKQQAKQNYVRGHVNHVVVETSQIAPDVVLGMFPVNSNLATVLFDSGASYSFVLTKYIAGYDLPVSLLNKKMVVTSLGRELLVRHVCPKISIKIRGVDFPSDLIVLDSHRIDINLGMDWLTKY